MCWVSVVCCWVFYRVFGIFVWVCVWGFSWLVGWCICGICVWWCWWIVCCWGLVGFFLLVMLLVFWVDGYVVDIDWLWYFVFVDFCCGFCGFFECFLVGNRVFCGKMYCNWMELVFFWWWLGWIGCRNWMLVGYLYRWCWIFGLGFLKGCVIYRFCVWILVGVLFCLVYCWRVICIGFWIWWGVCNCGVFFFWVWMIGFVWKRCWYWVLVFVFVDRCLCLVDIGWCCIVDLGLLLVFCCFGWCWLLLDLWWYWIYLYCFFD